MPDCICVQSAAGSHQSCEIVFKFSLLLGHIVRHWDAVGHRLNKQQLADLLQEFSNTSAELASGVGKDIDGYTHCVEVCKVNMPSLSFS